MIRLALFALLLAGAFVAGAAWRDHAEYVRTH